jgi:hypothetical protein
MAVDHATDDLGSDLVLLLAGLLVPVEEVVANTVVIQTVAFGVQTNDSAVVGHDEVVDARAQPLKELVVFSAGDQGFITGVDSATAVPPGLLFFAVVDNPGVCHASGVGFSDACGAVCTVKTTVRNGGGSG